MYESSLLLAEEQGAAAPVEVVLVEGVVAPGMLAGALITVERIGLSGLAENVDFELRAALEPPLEVLDEMAGRQVEAGRRGWPAASRAADERRRRGRRVEVGLDRLDGEHRCGRGPGGAQHLASASGIEGDRCFAVSERGGDEQIGPSIPLGAVFGNREVHLQCNRLAGVGFDRVLRIAADPGELTQRSPSFSLEKALEVNLVLADGRRVELGFDRGAKARIG